LKHREKEAYLVSQVADPQDSRLRISYKFEVALLGPSALDHS